MTDAQKIEKLESALRTERATLRQLGGPERIRAANELNGYLQTACTDSKLRLYRLLTQPAA